MFLYATAGYIDTNVELQPRKLHESQVKKEQVKKERHRVKTEVVSGSDEDDESPKGKNDDSDKANNPDVPAGLRRELQEFGDITTYEDLGKFMKVTNFSDKILADQALLGAIAPFMAAKAAKPSANESLAKFNSLSYERRMSAKEKVGIHKTFTIVSDVGEYILPAEDRIKFGNGLTFYYTGGGQE